MILFLGNIKSRSLRIIESIQPGNMDHRNIDTYWGAYGPGNIGSRKYMVLEAKVIGNIDL